MRELLGAGITPGAVAIVQEVTRPERLAYPPWIEKLALGGSISAVRVKLADNADDGDPERVASIPKGPKMLTRRYLPARAILEEGLAKRDAEEWCGT